MREPRETALLHGCKAQLHQLIACIFIYSTKWPYVKTMNAKNTKKSPIHENADANTTGAFGDGDISRSRSRFTHTHIASSIIVRLSIYIPLLPSVFYPMRKKSSSYSSQTYGYCFSIIVNSILCSKSWLIQFEWTLACIWSVWCYPISEPRTYSSSSIIFFIFCYL